MSSRPLILCDRASAEPSPYAKIITHWAHSPSSFLLPFRSRDFNDMLALRPFLFGFGRKMP